MHTDTELIEFLTTYPHELAFGTEDPATVLDRYFHPDFVYRSDSTRFDRRALIAHARPARKNTESVRVQVHRALVSGDAVAAHYTLHAVHRIVGPTATEICMVGHLSPDGRIAEVVQLTRNIPVEGE